MGEKISNAYFEEAEKSVRKMQTEQIIFISLCALNHIKAKRK